MPRDGAFKKSFLGLNDIERPSTGRLGALTARVQSALLGGRLHALLGGRLPGRRTHPGSIFFFFRAATDADRIVRTDSAVTLADLVAIRLHVGHELLEVVNRQRILDDDDCWRVERQADRLEILCRIVFEIRG